MLSPQIEASENMMKNSTKWNSCGVKKNQGYSPSTTEPCSLQSDPALKLMMQNEQAEHKQPQSMRLWILREPKKERRRRDRKRREERWERKEKVERRRRKRKEE